MICSKGASALRFHLFISFLSHTHKPTQTHEFKCVDPGGLVPASVMNSKMLPTKLGLLNVGVKMFSRDVKVTDATIDSVVRTMKTKPQEYTHAEKELLKRGREFYDKYNDRNADYKSIKSTDHQVKMKAVHANEFSLAVGVAEAVLDNEVEACVALEFTKDTRDAISARKGKGIIEVRLVKPNEHSVLYLSVRNLRVPGLSHREWRVKGCWEKQKDGTYFMFFCDTDELDDEFPVKAGNIVGSSQTAYLFEPLQRVGNVPQTKVTLVGRVDIRGRVPVVAMNRLIHSLGKNVSELRRKFSKSLEVDAEKRSTILTLMKCCSTNGFSEERFDKSFMEKKGKNRVKGAFPLVQSWTKTGIGGACWGKASFTVMATLEQTAAYFWDFESRLRPCEDMSTERGLDEANGKFDIMIKRIERLEGNYGGKMQRFREFSNKMSMHLVSEDKIYLLLEPGLQKANRRFAGIISESNAHCSEIAILELTRRTSGNATNVEFVSNADLGLFVSKKAAKSWMEKRLSNIGNAQQYFSYMFGLNDINEGLAEALAYDMAWKGGKHESIKSKSKKDRAAHVEEVISKSKALSEVRCKYPWIVTLMQIVREGAISRNNPVSTKLNCLKEEEARIIGSNLMPALKSRKRVEAGVDQWRRQNRAIDELLTEFSWMKALFEALGQEVVRNSSWGLKWRVFVGSFISVVDWVTDITMAYTYYKTRSWLFFKLTVGMLGASMSLTLFLTILQNRRRSLKDILYEVFPIFVGLKPAVDAFRVASGNKMEDGQVRYIFALCRGFNFYFFLCV